jgi:hypothetical protein
MKDELLCLRRRQLVQGGQRGVESNRTHVECARLLLEA